MDFTSNFIFFHQIFYHFAESLLLTITMRAPIIFFRDQIELGYERVTAFNCGSGRHTCHVNFFREIDIQSRNEDTYSVLDDDCVNVYDEQTTSKVTSAIPVDGCKIFCLGCDAEVGTRNGSLIVFNARILKNTEITYFPNHCILESSERPITHTIYNPCP